jgi:hypothetical protein
MSRWVVIIRSDFDREQAAAWALKAHDGMSITFKKSTRSLDQNSLMWARLTEIARQVDWYGRKLTPTDWKDMFTASLRKATSVPGIDPGTVVVLGLHTSDMTKDEMGLLLDLIDAFAAERGISFQETVAA